MAHANCKGRAGILGAPKRMNEEGRNAGKDAGIIVPDFLPCSSF
jgi:hypothetical protein